MIKNDRKQLKCGLLDTISVVTSDQYIEGFLQTNNPLLLSVVTVGTIVEGSAVTITKNTITVHSSGKTVSFDARDALCDALIPAYVRQGGALNLPYVSVSEARVPHSAGAHLRTKLSETPVVSRACTLS